MVNAVMNLRVPQNAGNFLTGCETVSFSRRTLLRGVSNYGLNSQGCGSGCGVFTMNIRALWNVTPCRWG